MTKKKILIFDEDGFSRVCQALLELDGYEPEVWKGIDISGDEYGLVITSFPYGAPALELARNKNLPALVLSDALSRDLLVWLHGLKDSFCMIKPVDFGKFNQIVSQMLSDSEGSHVGYKVI